jgi:glutamate-1-semialdehyde 2,1-aminomutase
MEADAYHPSPTAKRSHALWNRARAVSPMGAQGDGKYYPPYPHFIARAAGARLWDADGQMFIDYWNGAGPCSLGHGDASVAEAVARTEAERGVLYSAPHELEIELCETLARIIPCAEMSALLNAGSDILCMALRVARAATGRTLLVKFAGSYHGWYDDFLFNVSSYDGPPTNGGQYRPLPESAGLPAGSADNVRVLDYNDTEAVKTLFAAEGDRIAAVIVEPVMHGPVTGSIDPLPGFLQTIRALCDTHGAILVFDEILTGFRHALGGSQSVLGVVPDLAAFGKALSNGFPIAALCGRADLLRHLSPSGRAFFSGTYNGNVLSVAAALATIERLRDGTVFRHIYGLGARLRTALDEVFRTRGVAAHARAHGSMVAIHCSERQLDSFSDVMRHHDMSISPPLMAHLFAHGVYLKPRKVLRFAISAAHTEADIDRTVSLVDDHCAGRGSAAVR